MRSNLLLAATACLAAVACGLEYNTKGSIVPGAINVHLICHSHDDVGWLKSPEQYFSGAKNIGVLPSLYYANGAVQFTLDTVVAGLQANPDRKFVVVESWYHRKWLINRNNATLAAARALVASGQLQFANGGTVMHDEASPTWIDMVDQTTAGMRFLSETYGPGAAPRITSQIDPFGHSATQASLFSSPLAGYTGIMMARMDYEEVGMRQAAKTADFAWAASASLGPNKALTLGILGIMDGYGNPDGLCFDESIECYPFQDPINDDPDPDAADNNVLQYVTLAVQTAKRYAANYPTDPDGTAHVNWQMGSDFEWQNALMNFASLDRLIHYVNLNTSQHGVNLLYSTPAEYAAARIGTETPLALRTGDAFPYADSPHSYWTGYFTSRPALKGYVRDSSALFQAAKQVQAWAGGAGAAGTGTSNPLWLLETAMGVAQHHDAVSGTSKQQVAYDYARRLAQARIAADAAVSGWLNQLTGTGSSPLTWASCDLANATICPALEAAATGATPVALSFYNPQSHARSGVPVRVPVGLVPSAGVASWAAFGPDGKTPLLAQLLPVSSVDEDLRVTYYGAPAAPAGTAAAGATMAWLAFELPSVPPMGYVTVFLQPTASAEEAPHTHESVVTTIQLAAGGDGYGPTMTNGAVTLGFDAASGLLSTYAATGVNGGVPVNVSQSLFWYQSSAGDAASTQASGAYIFRVADNTTTTPVSGAGTPAGVANLTIITGPVVHEARQVFSPWSSQVLRLWSNTTTGFEVSWTVGPIPTTTDLVGKEVISRFNFSGWATDGAWSTDSNGRDMQPRQRNARSQFPFTSTEPVAQNYVPVNTAIRMVDSASGLAAVIVSDRTQGGASLADGSLELMIHRRLVWDDGRGVLEPLSEPGVDGQGLIARGTHTVLVAPSGGMPPLHRAAQEDSLLPLVWRAAALPTGVTPATWAPAHTTTFSGLSAAPLPPQVELVTVHSWGATTMLVRLAHLYEVGEHPVLSQPANVSLATLFAGVTVSAAVEMTLGGNTPLAEVPPVTYKVALAAEEAAARLAAGGAAAASVLTFAPSDGSAPTAYEAITLPVVPPAPAGAALTVTFDPMEVRTYMLTVAYPGSSGAAAASARL